MRKWTQKVKLIVSERIEPALKKTMQDECSREGKLFNIETNLELKDQYD